MIAARAPLAYASWQDMVFGRACARSGPKRMHRVLAWRVQTEDTATVAGARPSNSRAVSTPEAASGA